MTDLTDRTTHLFTPVGVASRPTSAKKARTATVVRATKDSKSEPEESGRVFGARDVHNFSFESRKKKRAVATLPRRYVI